MEDGVWKMEERRRIIYRVKTPIFLATHSYNLLQ